MATKEKNRRSFNRMLSNAYKSSITEISDGIDITSFTRAIFRQMFGAGTYIWVNGKTLIKTIEDAQTGDLKAINLNKKQLEIIYQQVKDFTNDPNLKLTVTQVMDEILKTIINLQVATKQIIALELNEQTKFDLDLAKTLYGIPPKTLEKVITGAKSILNGIIHAKDTNAFKKISDFTNKGQKYVSIGSLFQIGASAGSYYAARKLLNKMSVLIGPCPLKHTDYVEIARSGKVLKFRATGSVFLASQQGGDQTDAIKIEGTLYKGEFGIMFLLWALFLYGQSKFKDLDDLVTGDVDITGVGKLRKMNDLITTDSSLQRPSYEFHRTFPFVNKHFIIPNCYIETILLEDKLPLKDVVKYSILLRTYKKPMSAIRFVKSKDDNISTLGFNKKTAAGTIAEYSLNIAWRMFNAYGWVADEMQWRIGSACNPGVLDTYYDIDPMDIGTVVYLSLMGFTV